MWITDRHTKSSVAGESTLACAVVRADGVDARRVLIALVVAGGTLVDLHAVPLVGARVARQTFALVGSVDVHAVRVHVTMMSFLAAPLQTLICI